MKKQLLTEIEICAECPFFRMPEETCGHSYTYHVYGKTILDSGNIPSWCVLEEKTEVR